MTSNAYEYIPLSVPIIGVNEKKYVNECLDTNWISSAGRFPGLFEHNFAEYVKTQEAVAVQSGTAALHLCLICAGIGHGDEVMLPSLTFIAPVNAVSYTGAIPLFIDSEEESFGLSPEAIEAYVKENCDFDGSILLNRNTGRRIKAIVPVHLMGHSCRMDEIMETASKYKLTVIEDAAEAIGALYKGRQAGTIAMAGTFSFNGNKTLTTGGGGMIVSQNHELLARARHLSTQAKSDEFFYEHDATGYNYRMLNIQAAIGVAQLEQIVQMIERKRSIHLIYQEAFAKVPDITLFTEKSYCRSAYWFAQLSVPPSKRNDFIQYLAGWKIQARPFWKLNHLHPMYEQCPKGSLTHAEKLVSEGVSIPCSASMSDDDIKRVISAVSSFFS